MEKLLVDRGRGSAPAPVFSRRQTRPGAHRLAPGGLKLMVNEL
jgi:hypothetical protein